MHDPPEPSYGRPPLDALLGEAPIGFALLDSELRYVLVNDALARINGVSAAGHIGRSVREIVPDLAPQAETAFRQVLETGEPLRNLEIVGTVASEPHMERTWLESVYRVPVDGQAYGCAVIVVEVTEERRAVAERDAFARLLMQGLMPTECPVIPEASFVSYYAPARAADAGGDFWDCLQVADAGYVLSLGDAAGKGPRAAALMSVVRHSIRALARFEHRPSRLLSHLNAILLDQPLHEEATCLCTVAVARVDASDTHLRATLSLGGHQPPLLVRSDGTVESVDAFGTILGATAHAHHVDRSIDLSPGDSLVMFTDGLVEQYGLDQVAEEARLRDALASTATNTAEIMLSEVKSALLDGRDMTDDDIAVLILRKE